MDIVIDTSALLAVILGEPERDGVITSTRGHNLIGPGSIQWEVGNAFSALLKRRLISAADIQRGSEIFEIIPLRYMAIGLGSALAIAQRTNIYAYDAYFLDCAMRYAAPVLTLDKGMKRAAKMLDIRIVEV